MGVMVLKNKFNIFFFFFLFLLLISPSLLSTNYVEAAGRSSKFVYKTATGGDLMHEEVKRKKTVEEMEEIHERVLRANTKDYGRYDPAPVFVKPPFKLIPN